MVRMILGGCIGRVFVFIMVGLSRVWPFWPG